MKTLATATTVCLLAAAAHAQHSFSRTLTVDPSGNADYTTIQAAVNAIVPASPAIQQTILIYPGTYTEAVTLGSARDHVDLVGMDRDAVIVMAPSDSDAITIQGNGLRSNSIRDLTIRTDDDTAGEGRGIVIKENSTDGNPSAIFIAGVRIECDGDNSPAIDFEDACSDIDIRDVYIRNDSPYSPSIDGRLGTTVRVMNCDFSCDDGRLYVGDDWRITDSFLETVKMSASASADDTAPIEIWGHDNVLIDNCVLRGRGSGIFIQQDSDNILVSNCDIEGAHAGARIRCGTSIRFQGCRIAASSDNGKLVSLEPPEYVGVHIDKQPSNCTTLDELTFTDCEISGYSNESSRDAYGIWVEDAPLNAPALFQGCTISGEVTSSGDRAFGVAAGEIDASPNPVGDPDSVALIGGSVNAVNGDERQTTLYDLYSESSGAPWILTTGTEFSRWVSPIGAAVGEDVDVLRVVDVPIAGAATVLAATALQDDEQVIVNNISDPEVFRVLSVTSNDSDLNNKSVIIIGLDWALRPIADSIQLTGTTAANGVKAFRFVDKVILPEKTDDNQTVSVGTAEILGLHAPFSADSDVRQVATKTSAGTSYVIESSVGVVDGDRATVDVSSLSPADDDSIEFTYRASK